LELDEDEEDLSEVCFDCVGDGFGCSGC